jgi:hypothetical protein
MTDAPLTDAELNELEAVLRAASPAPWEAFIEERGALAGCSFIRIGGMDDSQPDMYVYHEDRIAPGVDIDFIATARNYLPRLLAEVRRGRAGQ